MNRKAVVPCGWPRRVGVTWVQVLLSSKTKTPILCKTKKGAEYVKKLAQDLELSIPEPVIFESHQELITSKPPYKPPEKLV